jgi:hypothetical protein
MAPVNALEAGREEKMEMLIRSVAACSFFYQTEVVM